MINLLFKLFVSLFICTSCWYSMKGSLPAHIKNISIAPVVNESAEFSASVILNDEIYELMITENVLDLAEPELADSRLNIVILSISDKPYSISLSDSGIEEVEEWKLTVKVDVTWYDLIRDEILFTKTISSWGSYTPGVDISTDQLDNDGDGLIDAEDSDENGSPRESALSISVRKLTTDIVSEINNTW